MSKEIYKTAEGIVIIGSYEDRAAYMRQDRFYRLRLNLFVRPEEEIVVREYFGTLKQIEALVSSLAVDEWNECFYESTLAALEEFQCGDKETLHYVGNRTELFLTPMTLLCRSACLMDDVRWKYIDKYGCTMRATAGSVTVNQVLLWDGGDRYVRCARYDFTGLRRVNSEVGWVPFDGESKSFPAVIEAVTADCPSSAVYVMEDDYFDYESAETDMKCGEALSFAEISRDLFTGV